MAEVDQTDAQGTPPVGRDLGGGDSTDAGPFSRGRAEMMDMEVEDSHMYVYNMSYPRRGKAIIINNRKFQSNTGMSERKGTDVDASDLDQRFKELGFTVDRRDNQTVSQMHKLLYEASMEDHSGADCFACAILSHGNTGLVYGVDGIIQVDTLTELYREDKCLSLAGKPKLFFIQACRGDKFDSGVEVCDGEEADGASQTIRAEADFLMAYSVVPGYFSWRNSNNGSWFIQAICKVLAQYGQTCEILWMMTRVNRMVAYEFQSNTDDPFMRGKKQIPCIMSMMTKELYFKPKSS